MTITLYNTMTGKKEKFIPLVKGKVGMYVCGPTVYDSCHIGHARSAVVFDVIVRYLRSQKFEVTYVRNFTDVDDKIINRANQLGIEPYEVSRKYVKEFYQDMDALYVERPTHEPYATKHIDNMIDFIQNLIKKKHAYEIDGDVYFAVDSFSQYGKLSGRKPEDMEAGARVDIDTRKKNPFDFALWKSSKPGEPAWESPWGMGRPGWHIECSAMSSKYLGESFDIHGGGKDLIFPHHENEIAQAEGATGKRFVNYWMHNGFLNIEGEKMSKSLGNFFTAREILEKYEPEAVRMFFLLKHYRSPINFSEQRMQEAKNALERIQATIRNIDLALNNKNVANKVASETTEAIKQEFIDAMDDDFNTASAMAKLFDLVKEANIILQQEHIAEHDLQILSEIKNSLYEYNSFLGILPAEQKQVSQVNEQALMDILIEIRKELREQKNWDLADKIRDRLKEKGIEIEDRKDKTVWRIASK